jgi:hypothetical protein
MERQKQSSENLVMLLERSKLSDGRDGIEIDG